MYFFIIQDWIRVSYNEVLSLVYAYTQKIAGGRQIVLSIKLCVDNVSGARTPDSWVSPLQQTRNLYFYNILLWGPNVTPFTLLSHSSYHLIALHTFKKHKD